MGDSTIVVCPSPLPPLGVDPDPSPLGALAIGTCTTLLDAAPVASAPDCVSSGLAMLLLLVPLLFLWWTEPPTAPPTTAAMTTTAPMIKIAIHFLVLHHGTSLCGYDSRISFDASAASA